VLPLSVDAEPTRPASPPLRRSNRDRHPPSKLAIYDVELPGSSAQVVSYLISNHLFSFGVIFLTQKFLQAQSKVTALAWISLAALIIQIPLLWILVFWFDWGTTGAALAYDITSWCVAIAQVVYVIGWCKEGWTGLSWLTFDDIWGFVRLSLATAVILALEICMNFNVWEAMVFIGINIAITYKSSKDYFSINFTNDKDLQVAVSKLAFLMGITMVLNSVQPVISGQVWLLVLDDGKAGGLHQHILLLCIRAATRGIWGGMIAGTALQTLMLLFILYRTNWNKEVQNWVVILKVEQTTEQMKKWGGHEINGDRQEKKINGA
ncbi:unnamed protein product, partial [Linum tenue]